MPRSTRAAHGLQRGAQLPLWRQIETDLIVDIQNGQYGPGDKLPTESELSARYGVNRHTVRMALASLADSRLVTAQQGRGVFVAERQVEFVLNRDRRWSDLAERLDARATGRLVAERVLAAPPHLAGTLGLDPGTPMLMMETVRQFREDVATYSYHSMCASRFAALPAAFARCGSFTEALAECGVPSFFRATTWIETRLPCQREAAALGLSVDQPIIVLTYITRDGELRPILHGHSVLPTDSVRLRFDDPIMGHYL